MLISDNNDNNPGHTREEMIANDDNVAPNPRTGNEQINDKNLILYIIGNQPNNWIEM